MRLREHSGALCVVRLPADAPHPAWATGAPLVAVTRSGDELSVLCPAAAVPAQLPAPLADAELSVFALSTDDTDRVLVPAGSAAAARVAWSSAGHDVLDENDPRDDAPGGTA